MITFFIITGIFILIVIFFCCTVSCMNNLVKFMQKHQEPEKKYQCETKQEGRAFRCLLLRYGNCFI